MSKKKNNIKETSKKIWHFLWHDDSIWAWIANLVVAFLLIKFIIYPLIGLLFGTSLPVVAVVSGSMDHSPANGELCGVNVGENADFWQECGEWYEKNGISKEQFDEFPLSKGFAKGDVIALVGVEPENVQVGDVIIFSAQKPYPIIHRVVNTTDYIQTKGDHNAFQIREYALNDGRYFYECYQTTQAGAQVPSLCGPGTQRVGPDTPNAIKILDELRISDDAVIGKAFGKIPYVGYIKILFVDFLAIIGFN